MAYNHATAQRPLLLLSYATDSKFTRVEAQLRKNVLKIFNTLLICIGNKML